MGGPKTEGQNTNREAIKTNPTKYHEGKDQRRAPGEKTELTKRGRKKKKEERHDSAPGEGKGGGQESGRAKKRKLKGGDPGTARSGKEKKR